MSELPGDVHTAIKIAIALADGNPSPALIGKAIALTGYKLVPIDGTAADRREQSGVGGAAALRAPAKWPQICTKCNKVINDKAHAEDCERTDCPF